MKLITTRFHRFRRAPLPRHGRRCGTVLVGSLLVCLALLTPLPLTAQEFTISTVAGRPVLGDGGPAVQGDLDNPDDLAVDGAGNLYIADTRNDRIRKVDATGTITTVAGNSAGYGTEGFGEDGGPAVHAQLNYPVGVAVDGAGNLYIADRENHRIRKVDATGTIIIVEADRGHSAHPRLRDGVYVLIRVDGTLGNQMRGAQIWVTAEPDQTICIAPNYEAYFGYFKLSEQDDANTVADSIERCIQATG